MWEKITRPGGVVGEPKMLHHKDQGAAVLWPPHPLWAAFEGKLPGALHDTPGGRRPHCPILETTTQTRGGKGPAQRRGQ